MADAKTEEVHTESEKRATDEVKAGTEKAQTEQEKPVTDWKAEARKWEARAKENKGKADELDALKEAQMTESEKQQKELEEVKGKLSALQREKERAGWIDEVSQKTGLSVAQLKAIAAESKEELAEKAQLFAQTKEPEKKDLPVVLGDGKHANHEPSQTANDWLRSTIPNH